MDPANVTPNPQLAPAERFDPEPFRPDVAAFLQRRGASQDAEDLTQEALLKGLLHPPSEDREAAQPWLIRIARNLLVDKKRKQQRFARALPYLTHEVHLRSAALAKWEDPSERTERIAAARVAIQGLPTQQRRALELRLLSGLAYEEVGARIDCSAATARQHFHLAVKALRARLAPFHEDDHEDR